MLQSAWVGLKKLFALNETHDENNNCHNKKEVDERAGDMEGKKSQTPKNEKYKNERCHARVIKSNNVLHE